MQKTIRALMLVLALVISSNAVNAGNMGNGAPEPTPPPPPAATSTQTSTEPISTEGNMGYPVMDAATGVALNVLQTLLALF